MLKYTKRILKTYWWIWGGGFKRENTGGWPLVSVWGTDRVLFIEKSRRQIGQERPPSAWDPLSLRCLQTFDGGVPQTVRYQDLQLWGWLVLSMGLKCISTELEDEPKLLQWKWLEPEGRGLEWTPGMSLSKEQNWIGDREVYSGHWERGDRWNLLTGAQGNRILLEDWDRCQRRWLEGGEKSHSIRQFGRIWWHRLVFHIGQPDDRIWTNQW